METKEILDGPIKEKQDKKNIEAYMKSLLKKIDFRKLLFVLLFFFVCYVISELLNGEEVMFIKMLSPSSTWAKRIENTFITLDNFFRFPKFIVNYLMFIFAYWILYGVSNRTKLACTVIAIITFIFGILNYVITDLRGVAITISDIYSIQTAANVIKGVKLNVEGNFIVATVLFIVSLFIMFKCVKIKEKRENKTRTAKMITIILGVFGMITLFVPNYFTDEVEMWDVNRAYAHSGVGLTIARMVKDLKVKRPNEYSLESVQSILARYSDDTEEITKSNDYPNIVVIMDESFADLPMTYSIELNDDPIPFYHKLIKGDNIISGIMHSSQFGGGTANVEYEFLTQNVTAFLPPGAMPYQQYITRDVKQSIVAYMNKLRI